MEKRERLERENGKGEGLERENGAEREEKKRD